MKAEFKTREEWLRAAYDIFVDRLKPHGALPKEVHILCSWPHGSRKAIGQFMDDTWVKNQSSYIFISPTLEDRTEILHTLIHEMIHALGISGHGKVFKRIGTKLGLEGKMKASHAGPDLMLELLLIADKLGKYPHATIVEKPKLPKTAKKTIMRFMSPVDPDYVIWMTPAKAASYGPPICPVSKELMVAVE